MERRVTDRGRRHPPLIVIFATGAAGAALGFLWAHNLIDREHLSPTDPYIPIIYEKFIAAWGAGFGFGGMIITYLIEFLLGSGPKPPPDQR